MLPCGPLWIAVPRMTSSWLCHTIPQVTRLQKSILIRILIIYKSFFPLLLLVNTRLKRACWLKRRDHTICCVLYLLYLYCVKQTKLVLDNIVRAHTRCGFYLSILLHLHNRPWSHETSDTVVRVLHSMINSNTVFDCLPRYFLVESILHIYQLACLLSNWLALLVISMHFRRS